MKIFNRLHAFYENRYRASIMRGFMDMWWYALIRASFVLVFIAIAFGGWVLYEAWFGIPPAPAGALMSDTLSRKDLTEALEWFSERRVRYDATARESVSIVDPAR